MRFSITGVLTEDRANEIIYKFGKIMSVFGLDTGMRERIEVGTGGRVKRDLANRWVYNTEG